MGSPSEHRAGGDSRIAPTSHLSTLTHLPLRRRSPLPGPLGPAPLLWRGQWDPGAGLAGAAPAGCAGRSASAGAAPPAGTRAAAGRSPADAATGDLPGVGRPGAESVPIPAWPLIISRTAPVLHRTRLVQPRGKVRILPCVYGWSYGHEHAATCLPWPVGRHSQRLVHWALAGCLH